ncbi:hypothetical protein D9M69_385250 [compost metagenome]
MIDSVLDDLIQSHFVISMADVYTAIPCVVLNVHGDFSQQRVDVRPAINDKYKDGTSREHAPILSVPVILPGTRNSLISFPVNVGDTVMCIFSQRSMDNFKIGNGQPGEPNDFRKHSDQDAVAIPGLAPFSRSVNSPAVRKYQHAPNQDLVIAHNIGSGTETMIQLKLDGQIIINTDEAVTVNAKSVNVNAQSGAFDIDSSTWNGDMDITGSWTFNGIPFNTHKHIGVVPGSGTSGTPTA